MAKQNGLTASKAGEALLKTAVEGMKDNCVFIDPDLYTELKLKSRSFKTSPEMLITMVLKDAVKQL